MNADVEVMKFFPRTLEPQESDALVDEFQAEFEQSGFCPFVVGLRGEGSFLGFLGLHSVSAEMAFAPAVEVGWRLELKAWGTVMQPRLGPERCASGSTISALTRSCLSRRRSMSPPGE